MDACLQKEFARLSPGWPWRKFLGSRERQGGTGVDLVCVGRGTDGVLCIGSK